MYYPFLDYFSIWAFPDDIVANHANSLLYLPIKNLKNNIKPRDIEMIKP